MNYSCFEIALKAKSVCRGLFSVQPQSVKKLEQELKIHLSIVPQHLDISHERVSEKHQPNEESMDGDYVKRQVIDRRRHSYTNRKSCSIQKLSKKRSILKKRPLFK